MRTRHKLKLRCIICKRFIPNPKQMKWNLCTTCNGDNFNSMHLRYPFIQEKLGIIRLNNGRRDPKNTLTTERGAN